MGNAESATAARNSKKAVIVVVLTALALLLGEIFVTADTHAYEKALAVMPGPFRQEYLDYVLAREYGPFRTYTHKVNALRVLQQRIKQGRPLAYDPLVVLGLLEGGMDHHWEPIPVSAAKLVLLVNDPRIYEEFLRLYRGDDETLSHFEDWIERMTELEPQLYPEMRHRFDDVAKKMPVDLMP